MTAPGETATTPQEQNTTRSRQSPQQPPGRPHNGPKDELLLVSDGESEHNSEHDSENEGEWPCICGDGLDTEGTWIRCDRSKCQLTWYHLACVGLEEAPAGKWYCPQCRACTRDVSLAKPDPRKKFLAIKAPQKEQPRWKGWKELPADQEEEFKRRVESSWETQILPGKTRSGPRRDPQHREVESECTGNGKSPRQELQMDRSKRLSGKKAYVGPPCNKVSELSLQSGSSTDGQTASKPERTVSPKDMTINDKAALPVEDDTRSNDWENVMDDDKIASGIVEPALESELVSNDPTVRSSRLTTLEAASVLLSVSSTTSGERINLEPKEGDQALVSALRGAWVGQYFA